MIIDDSTPAAVVVMANDLSQELDGWHHPRDHLLQTNPSMGNISKILTIRKIRKTHHHHHNTPPTLTTPATSVRNNPGSKASSSSSPRMRTQAMRLLPARRLTEAKRRC